LASCATITFQVEHPPEIDLSNVKTITVIPFEWSSSSRDEHLSRCATSALINGIRMGKIDYVDPQVLENTSVSNYWKYADVYITGRINNARTSRSNEIREESYWNHYSNKHETITIMVTIITTTVEIEYSYIRSIDSAVLGSFKKSESGSVSYDRPVNRDRYRDLNRNSGRAFDRQDGARRNFQQWRGVDTETAEAVIAKFSYTMAQELGPYTTTEKRSVKNTMLNDRRVIEANTYIRQERYDEALTLYRDIYKQNNGAAAGYNTAILLIANKKYAEALELLTNLQKNTEASGKKSPSFIKKEIKALTGFINGFKLLELYRINEAITVSNAGTTVSETAQKAVKGQISGTANISEAEVYALKDSISSAKDPTVFIKLVAYTGVSKGQWSMNVPDGGPSSLWFVLIEQGRFFYISKTPINISTKVVLDTALMNRLEDN
jgi:tetratricopeptide (TPR) repeat protein